MTQQPRKRRKKRHGMAGAVSPTGRSSQQVQPVDRLESVPLVAWLAVNGVWVAGIAAVLLYSYWPTLTWMVGNWNREPDYSHGWIVLPLAISIALLRRDTFPGMSTRLRWGGLALVGLSIGLRLLGRMIYADFMDAWSLVLLVGGGVWLLFGPAVFRWSLPAVGFLFFAIPIPYQAESLLSFQLQGVATQLSTALLRVFGQPAVSQGHLIWVGSESLNIEPACSGLRIFVGLAATAYYFAAITARNWGDRALLLFSVVPVALLVNSIRIVATGWLYQWTTSSETRHAIHDYSGLLMIPLGFALMYAVFLYWTRLYRPVDQVLARDFLPNSPPQTAAS